MRNRAGLALGALLAGALYWQLVSIVTGAAEPWDDGAYWWLWYPLALLMCAVMGFFFRERSWLASTMLIVAQLPVLWANSDVGPLIMAGLLLTIALVVPAVTVSSASALIVMRLRST